MLVATIDAQWEGMGDVGSARYENSWQSFVSSDNCNLAECEGNFVYLNLWLCSQADSQVALRRRVRFIRTHQEPPRVLPQLSHKFLKTDKVTFTFSQVTGYHNSSRTTKSSP